MTRLKLSGVGEGFDVVISTRIVGADSPSKVLASVQNLFPGFSFPLEEEPKFPSEQNNIMAASAVPLDIFLNALYTQQILDTALDAMSINLDSEGTVFELSRQAAMAGKVAFVMPNERPLGGVIVVEIIGEDAADWLEAATWHSGRETIPRKIGDELQMSEHGEAITWH
ncbi:MAG: hypothetical protein QGI21_06110 [Candidatus Poseidoniaceae archaeon]|jgi:predicted RNA binding protein with dsRBD fold (UPF0201 family)|nr:hypothetical protein [Candidatus Poseidoniaceae archaeon]